MKKLLSAMLMLIMFFAIVFQFLVTDSFAQSPPRDTYISFQRMDGFLHFIECEDRASLVAEVGPELYEEEYQGFCDFAEDLWNNGFVLVESPDCGLYSVLVEPGYYTYTISNGFSRVKQCDVHIWLLDEEEKTQLAQFGVKDFFFGADRIQMMSLSRFIHQEFESEEKKISLNNKERDTVIFTKDVDVPGSIGRYEVIHYDRFLICVSFLYLGGDPNNLPAISIVEKGQVVSGTALPWYWIVIIVCGIVLVVSVVTVLLLRRRKKAKAVLEPPAPPASDAEDPPIDSQ